LRRSIEPLLIKKRWRHHTASGGYDQLCDFIEGKTVLVKKERNYPFKEVREGVRKRLFPSTAYANHYRRADFMAELKTLALQRRYQQPLVHAIYAEDQLNLLLKYRNWLNAALVGSFHLPEDSGFMRRLIRGNYSDKYTHLDAAIVMSQSMIPFTETIVGKGKVFWVPHGIRTDIFTPAEENLPVDRKEIPKIQLLTVGNHGRDWNTYKKVVLEAKKEKLPVDFTAIVSTGIQRKLSGLPGVKLFSKISEEDLISIYRSADILYMPVTFSSANNSILEAMACGVPTLSNRVGGVPDYVGESSGWLVPGGDVTETVSILKEVEKYRNRLSVMKRAARSRSLEFDWNRIAGQVQEVYALALERWEKSV
jgi:glycosyltransferase involved in cell wall biosynthesis